MAKMFAALIFVFSVFALMRFGVAQWRSIWRSMADQPLSGGFEAASGIAADAIGPDDFEAFAAICKISCRLPRQSEIWLKEVAIYYRSLRMLHGICSKMSPSVAEWAEKELTVCSRYAGAVLDHSVNASFAYASLSAER
jgi:hypothetical protein